MVLIIIFSLPRSSSARSRQEISWNGPRYMPVRATARWHRKWSASRAATIFGEPPGLAVREQRLCDRNTDDEESIRRRLAKAEYEMGFAPRYDLRVVNDNLDEAVDRIADAIADFTK